MKRYLIAAAVLLCAAATGSAQDIPLSKILVEGEEWKVAAKDLPDITFLEGEPKGSMVIYQKTATWEITASGKVEKMPRALGEPEVKVPPVAVYHGRAKYSIDEEKHAVIALVPKAENKFTVEILKHEGQPSCLVLWPDGGQLVFSDACDNYLYTARIDKDGKFSSVDRYYSLRMKHRADKTSGVKSMVMDAGYRLYACTPLGVQVFDPTGRLCGVILPPSKEEMTAITIGGEKGDTLFVAAGDKVYSRKIQGKAVYTLKKEK